MNVSVSQRDVLTAFVNFAVNEESISLIKTNKTFPDNAAELYRVSHET